MEKIFDLTSLRARGEVLCEFSALAISPEYRGRGGSLLHSFFRFFYRYVKTWCGVDYFVVAVNPQWPTCMRPSTFFNLADQWFPVIPINLSMVAPAIPLFLPLNNFEAELKEIYFKKSLRKNLFRFLQSSYANSDVYPSHEYFQIKSTILTPDFVQALRTEIPDIETRFTPRESLRIAQSLGSNSFSEIGNRRLKQTLRIQMNTSTRVCLEGATEGALVKVCDISLDGIKAFCRIQTKNKKGFQQIRVRLGPNIFCQVKLEAVWDSDQGYTGVRLLETDQEWKRFFHKLKRLLADYGFKLICL